MYCNYIFNNAILFNDLGAQHFKLHWACELVNQGLERTIQYTTNSRLL